MSQPVRLGFEIGKGQKTFIEDNRDAIGLFERSEAKNLVQGRVRVRLIGGTHVPQISRAVPATSLSLASSSSIVSRLPSRVDANPHWVLSASLSWGIIADASRTRALSSSLFSSAECFVLTRPSTTTRSPGTWRSGSNPPDR